jgi:hypothetical protein
MSKSLTVLALLASLCASARADDVKGDHSACWDEPRQDMSCTKLILSQ